MAEGWLRPFPARVQTPTTTYRKARVWVGEGRVKVFIAVGSKVCMAAEGEVANYTVERARVVLEVDGEMWTMRRDGGCACGSPLKKITDPAIVA